MIHADKATLSSMPIYIFPSVDVEEFSMRAFSWCLLKSADLTSTTKIQADERRYKNCQSHKLFSGSEIRIRQTSWICSKDGYHSLTGGKAKGRNILDWDRSLNQSSSSEHQVLHHLLVGDFPQVWSLSRAPGTEGAPAASGVISSTQTVKPLPWRRREK